MAKVTGSFQLSSQTPNFERDMFNTVAEMVAFDELKLPDVFIASVKETGSSYVFNRNNISDVRLGKWKKLNNQYAEMPTEIKNFDGDIVQYIGETTEDFEKGVFYGVSKEDSGTTESKTMYAFEYSGDTYFTETATFGDGEEVSLYSFNGSSFEKVSGHFAIYYEGDSLYFDDLDEGAMERKEASDETIENVIYNYSWIALSSSGGKFATEEDIEKIFE